MIFVMTRHPDKMVETFCNFL